MEYPYTQLQLGLFCSLPIFLSTFFPRTVGGFVHALFPRALTALQILAVGNMCNRVANQRHIPAYEKSLLSLAVCTEHTMMRFPPKPGVNDYAPPPRLVSIDVSIAGRQSCHRIRMGFRYNIALAWRQCWPRLLRVAIFGDTPPTSETNADKRHEALRKWGPRRMDSSA